MGKGVTRKAGGRKGRKVGGTRRVKAGGRKTVRKTGGARRRGQRGGSDPLPADLRAGVAPGSAGTRNVDRNAITGTAIHFADTVASGATSFGDSVANIFKNKSPTKHATRKTGGRKTVATSA